MRNSTPSELKIKNESMKSGRFCYVPVDKDDMWTLGIAVKNVKGYYSTDYPGVDSHEKAAKWADDLNKKRMDLKEAAKIVASTF